MWIITRATRMNKGKQGERGLGFGEKKESDDKEENYLGEDKLKEDERGAGKVERVFIILHQRQYAPAYIWRNKILQSRWWSSWSFQLLWLMYLGRSAKTTTKTLLTNPAKHLP